jgi:hypothetical protein
MMTRTADTASESVLASESVAQEVPLLAPVAVLSTYQVVAWASNAMNKRGRNSFLIKLLAGKRNAAAAPIAERFGRHRTSAAQKSG